MIAVVIPSRNVGNLAACVAAVKQCEPDARIIAVDDGLGPMVTDITVVPGVKPFIFSRNVNIGVRKAFENEDCEGIVILGDDGLLKSAGGFSTLAKTARENEAYGVIASSCNNVGNLNQRPQGIGLRNEPRMVCFICAYIRRDAWEKIGELDESFDCYSHQDDDYCVRTRLAGFKIGVHDGCFVDHGSLKSTFRSPGGGAELVTGGRIFKNKWGGDNRSV